MNYGENLRLQCVSVVPNRPTLAIVGDSHAAVLGPAIQALAQSANWGFAVLAKPSCRPLKGVTVRMKLDKRFAAECATFTEQALRWLAQNPSVRSVILAGLWTGPITNPNEHYQRLDGTSNDDGATLLAHRAVLCISAHWFLPATMVTAMRSPRTIHDFGGFPAELYQVEYPAPGDPEIAQRVKELLAPLDVVADNSWGLDHGTWSVLLHVYADADVPVVQLSMDETKSAAAHFEAGKWFNSSAR